MIETVWVKNQNGERLDLNLRSSKEEHGLLIYNMSGLGPPAATVNGEGGPYFDGIRVNSVVGDSRSIELTLAVTGRGDVEELSRKKIYRYFPIKQSITFGMVVDSIDYCIDAVVEGNEFNHFAKVENGVISLLCPGPDPYFMEVAEQEYVLPNDEFFKLFEFPFMNDDLTESLIEFSKSTPFATVQIENVGKMATGCDIIIYIKSWVDADTIQIRNGNGNQEMTIDMDPVYNYLVGEGEIIATDDWIEINTRVGEKSIVYHKATPPYLTVNLINDISMDSDWIEIRPGQNTIVLSEPEAAQLDVVIKFNALVEGL